LIKQPGDAPGDLTAPKRTNGLTAAPVGRLIVKIGKRNAAWMRSAKPRATAKSKSKVIEEDDEEEDYVEEDEEEQEEEEEEDEEGGGGGGGGGGERTGEGVGRAPRARGN